MFKLFKKKNKSQELKLPEFLFECKFHGLQERLIVLPLMDQCGRIKYEQGSLKLCPKCAKGSPFIHNAVQVEIKVKPDDKQKK